MSSPSVEIILGTSNFGDPSDPIVRTGRPQAAQEIFNTFRKYGGSRIDTARRYPPGASGTSELLIGKTDIAQWAKVDTKVFSMPGYHSAEGISKSVDESLKALGIPKINTDYLHFPDRTIPLREVCKSMNDAIQAGKIENWGVSNYSIDDIKQIVQICSENNYPKPAAYQGHYNAIARRAEDGLLPLLRQHGIAFYAYSPGAGGFFSKESSRASEKTSAFHSAAYGHESLANAIAHVQAEADAAGLSSGYELALRWVLYHSALKGEHGDAIIVGCSSNAQLENTMQGCAKGPLPQHLAQSVDGIWGPAKNGAPPYAPGL